MLSPTTDLKAAAIDRAGAVLHEFLQSEAMLTLPRSARPRLSILLVLYNRAELTLACLRSIQPQLPDADAEVILVDNASRDETSALLDRIRGATVIRNGENRGFPAAVNQAAAVSAGDYLLLLNNDAEVLGDSVNAALRFLGDNREVGAVGGRIILLDGTLQEAGCALWREGHVLQYGRGDSPTAPEYLFRREVDYCSGAFLMTRRDLFHELGGLDTSFSPAYFEDADYCVRLWRTGWRVVYLPDIAVRHHENGSSTCPQILRRLYRRNHAFFTHKHADWLSWKQTSSTTSSLWARSSHDARFRILLLPARNASKTDAMVRRLRSLNCFVTVFPIDIDATISPGPMPEFPADVEVLIGGRLDTMPGFLAQRRYYYDCILASDPEILEQIRRWKQHVSDAGRDV